MEAMGALNPVDVLEGEIQAKIARFLSMKAVLNKSRSSSMLNIRTEAEKLYVSQQQLETDLATNLERIKVMKSGAWDMSGIVQIGSFGMNLMKHIKKVEALNKNAVQSGAIDDDIVSLSNIKDLVLSPVGLGIMGIGILLLIKKL